MANTMFPTDFNDSHVIGWLQTGDIPPQPTRLTTGAYPHSSGRCAVTVTSPFAGQVMQCSVCSPAIGLDLNLERRTPILMLTAPDAGPLTLSFSPGVRSVGLFAALLALVGTPYEATLAIRLQGSTDFEDMPPVSGVSDHVCLPGEMTTAAFLSAGVSPMERIEAIRVNVHSDVAMGRMAVGWIYHWMS
ncbi:hypothetical protein G7047_29060 [Diaphorobacter sp. HDW4A]|uniref:hypothetical protein n=1 Tax=Diaphorobacter sp. HDW4A TaxID=2714924 RepID=UPI00140CA680|nr:hypothetical protein [Diaphorobacter sp. HDW4A]QIL83541.1 hypothetical protein G7047_29060 [Diaphorobacter sp. HDW4A]